MVDKESLLESNLRVLESLTRDELRHVARECGVPIHGSKLELFNRVKSALVSQLAELRSQKEKSVGRPSLGLTKKVSLTLPEESWERVSEKAAVYGSQSAYLRSLVEESLDAPPTLDLVDWSLIEREASPEFVTYIRKYLDTWIFKSYYKNYEFCFLNGTTFFDFITFHLDFGFMYRFELTTNRYIRKSDEELEEEMNYQVLNPREVCAIARMWNQKSPSGRWMTELERG